MSCGCRRFLAGLGHVVMAVVAYAVEGDVPAETDQEPPKAIPWNVR